MSEHDSKVRAFIAVELPEEVKLFLKELSEELGAFGREVRWTRPQGIHLTLKFLGNVRKDALDSICERASVAFSDMKPVRLGVHGLGAFPGLNKPRVIWAGLKDETGTAALLAEKIESLLEPLGFKREKRPFRPHLTLGRVKSRGINPDLKTAIVQKMDLSGPSFVADGAILFRSILKPSGAEYEALHRFDFQRG
jgi:2'-5' RNA ligase